MKKLALLPLFIFCFWHLFATQKIESSHLIALLNAGQDIYLENVVITGDINLTQLETKDLYTSEIKTSKNILDIEDIYDQTSDNYFVNIDQQLVFINCEFTGSIIGYESLPEENIILNTRFNKKIHFKNCTFKQDLLFKYAEFNGITEFIKAKLLGKSNFKFAVFNNYTCFNNTRFGCCSTFSNTIFNSFSSFLECTFSEQARFNHAIFNGMAVFSKSTFNKKSLFGFAEFKKVFFDKIKFFDKVSFQFAKFSDTADFTKSAFSSNSNFSNSIFNENIILNGTKFSYLPEFKNASKSTKYFLPLVLD